VEKLLACTSGVPANVPITNARGAFSDSLTEYCIGAILYFNKQMNRLAKNKLERRWEKFRMNVVSDKTAGFLGFGSIAFATARLCSSLRMRIVACSRTGRDSHAEPVVSQIYRSTVESDLTAFIAQCDYLICSLPSTPLTHHLCDKSFFSRMKSSSIFISIGRGDVVDESALVEALQAGVIGGAALDVFETEPLLPNSPLWDLDNCLISSHNADWTETYLEDSIEIFQKNLLNFLTGRPLDNLVDRDAGY